MPTLVRHDNLAFADQTVYMAGHAFSHCTFDRCTMVVRESTSVLEHCEFRNCVWHLDVLVSERERFRQLVDHIGPLLLNSLPAAADAPHAVAPRTAHPGQTANFPARAGSTTGGTPATVVRPEGATEHRSPSSATTRAQATGPHPPA
jgi:hypothetical protein